MYTDVCACTCIYMYEHAKDMCSREAVPIVFLFTFHSMPILLPMNVPFAPFSNNQEAALAILPLTTVPSVGRASFT